MISAKTQWAEVGWYSNRVPGSQFRRHDAILVTRAARSDHIGGPRGALGNPEVWSMTCSTVMEAFGAT
jgi:hypothetical protein